MLGKASELKAITFDSSYNYPLDMRLNEWLLSNPKCVIIDIKFGFAMTTEERAESALIIYKEAAPNDQADSQ